MGAVKKKYTIETGGDNFLVTEDEGGASVGLEFTYDNSGGFLQGKGNVNFCLPKDLIIKQS